MCICAIRTGLLMRCPEQAQKAPCGVIANRTEGAPQSSFVHLAPVCNSGNTDEFRRIGDDVRHAPITDPGAPLILKVAMGRENLAQFLLESSLAGADLNLERQKDYGRLIDL